MRTIGADNDSSLRHVDLYTSHEALLLEYEQSFTRKWRDPSDQTPHEDKYFNTSAHFIWIGDRTRQLDGAHVEYFRGVENPIGIKVGPTMKTEEFGQLLDIVNPRREIGKVTLITRYGCDKIGDILPSHIQAVKETGHPVIWQCDPMHGNTRSMVGNPDIKTRQFSSIMSEISSALRIHKEAGTWLGGIHLELTGVCIMPISPLICFLLLHPLLSLVPFPLTPLIKIPIITITHSHTHLQHINRHHFRGWFLGCRNRMRWWFRRTYR